MLTAPDVDRSGRVLQGTVRLDRLLAVGGMASVYEATHLTTQARVAVKILRSELADPDAAWRVFAESQAANRIGHPGVVRVLDGDVDDDGTAFLVMDLLDGETVDRWSKRLGAAIAPRDVACLMFELLDVLAAAHDHGVIHRDVKPSNVFLTSDGTVKLLDFGIAHVTGLSLSPLAAHALGTPGFMAPEQATGGLRDIDARSDLWSVAAMAFALLSGRHVHRGKTPLETMLLCASASAPLLATVAPGVPAPLARVIDQGLRFQRDDRWASARAMQTAVALAYREAFGARLPEGGPARSASGVFDAPARGSAADEARVAPRHAGVDEGPGAALRFGPSSPPPASSGCGVEPTLRSRTSASIAHA